MFSSLSTHSTGMPVLDAREDFVRAMLPPIAVVQGPDGYYVADGRHRVSVALASGRGEIDAWVR